MAVVPATLLEDKLDGLGHCVQSTLILNPAALVAASEVNLTVTEPSDAIEEIYVVTAGIVVDVYVNRLFANVPAPLLSHISIFSVAAPVYEIN